MRAALRAALPEKPASRFEPDPAPERFQPSPPSDPIEAPIRATTPPHVADTLPAPPAKLLAVQEAPKPLAVQEEAKKEAKREEPKKEKRKRRHKSDADAVKAAETESQIASPRKRSGIDAFTLTLVLSNCGHLVRIHVTRHLLPSCFHQIQRKSLHTERQLDFFAYKLFRAILFLTGRLDLLCET